MPDGKRSMMLFQADDRVWIGLSSSSVVLMQV